MRRDFDEEEEEEELYEEEEEELYEEEEDTGRGKKRRRSRFIDDAAEEDDEEEEEDDDDDEDYGGGGGGRVKKRKKMLGAPFIDDEVEVVDEEEEEEEEEEGEEDFIDRNDVPGEDDGRGMHRGQFSSWEDDQEDVEVLARRINERYLRINQTEYDEETTEVDQQAHLPSVRDPKLWMVKCAIGREREAAVCLMQKYIDKGSELQIKSAVALDHLKNFIYVEADKESHVKEACKGLRNIYAQNVKLVPIREMTDVLSVASKSVDLARDSWVRMKIGIYKGDLAKVANVDNVRQKIVVKLIPRIDLQALSNKLEGREVAKKKAFVPPPRLMNVEEARELHLRVESRRDSDIGEFFEVIDNMMFKDGFLYKKVSMKSVRSVNINPTFDELEKFRTPGENGDGDIEGLSTLFGNRKKGHFMKGDTVIVIKGDLKNLKGRVEKVEEENVHIKPEMKGLPQTLALNEKELCKYFEPGNHVKVVSGKQEGATGMVVKVEGYVLIILSDTTKEHIRVFGDDVAESSEVTSGVTRIGDYEVHDLVQLNNNSFGVIIRVESQHFQVLKGVSERPEIVLVKVRDIKYKIEKKFNGQDCFKNPVSAKDVVKIVEGSLKGKQGPVEYIYRGILFIHDRHHLEHAGFICVKSQSCVVIGGSRSNSDINMRVPTHVPQSPGRFSSGGPPIPFGGSYRGRRGQDSLIGKTIKVRQGPYKGYRGRVVDVKGQSVRVELESQMKVVTVERNQVADNVVVATPYLDTSRFGSGSETPMHPSRTPLHPCTTPMRDPGATPIHDGMRTPMRGRAWNPYTPMSPPRDNWEDANPGSWGASPKYQPESTPSRTYEAPTPGSGWAGTPGGSYSEAGTPSDSNPAYANSPIPYMPSTPGGQPLTPNSASYSPGTPGGQPMTPGTGGLDIMSPIGGENEGPWFVPDILVSVHRSGGETVIGAIREVLSDGSCKVVIGSSENKETVTALHDEMEIVAPKKSDKIKVMSGTLRGATGKLIGLDGTDGIVKLDDTLDVKIFDLVILARLAHM